MHGSPGFTISRFLHQEFHRPQDQRISWPPTYRQDRRISSDQHRGSEPEYQWSGPRMCRSTTRHQEIQPSRTEDQIHMRTLVAAVLSLVLASSGLAQQSEVGAKRLARSSIAGSSEPKYHAGAERGSLLHLLHQRRVLRSGRLLPEAHLHEQPASGPYIGFGRDRNSPADHPIGLLGSRVLPRGCHRVASLKATCCRSFR